MEPKDPPPADPLLPRVVALLLRAPFARGKVIPLEKGEAHRRVLLEKRAKYRQIVGRSQGLAACRTQTEEDHPPSNPSSAKLLSSPRLDPRRTSHTVPPEDV